MAFHPGTQPQEPIVVPTVQPVTTVEANPTTEIDFSSAFRPGYTTVSEKPSVSFTTGNNISKVTSIGFPPEHKGNKPNISKLTTIEYETPVPATPEEFNRYTNLVREMEKLENEIATSGDNYLNSARLKEVKDEIKYTCNITSEGTDVKNKVYYKKLLTRNYLGNLFFNTSLKYGGKYDVESDYYIDDTDYEKYSNKTWFFTNIPVEEHTVHFITRDNRIGLVPYKGNINMTPFAALNIPKDKKGIFIVRNVCLARPELHGVCSFTSPHLTNEHSIGIFNVDRLKIEQSLQQLNPKDANELVAPPIIQPLPENKQDPGYNNLDERNISLRRFLENREKNGLSPITSYNNLFNPGVAAYEIRLDKNTAKGVYIDRWEGIIRANYNNKHMGIYASTPDELKYNGMDFNKHIREYNGNLSNQIYRYPVTPGEKQLITNNTKPINLRQTFGTDITDQIDMAPLAPEQSLLYNSVISKIPNIEHFNCRDARESISKITSNYRDKLTFNNAIGFQDVIFIPLEDILNNHGQLYEHTSDTLFAFNDIVDSRILSHPSKTISNVNTIASYNNYTQHNDFTNTNLVGKFGSVVYSRNIGIQEPTGPKTNFDISIEIISTPDANVGKVYYINTYGYVQTLAAARECLPTQGVSGPRIVLTYKDPRSSELKREVLSLTEENLRKLEIYHTREEAQVHGYTELHYNKEQMQYRFSELEAKNQQLLAERERLQLEIEKRNQELKLKEKEFLVREKELEVKEKELETKEKEFLTKEKELLARQEELLAKVELRKVDRDIKHVDRDMKCIDRSIRSLDKEIKEIDIEGKEIDYGAKVFKAKIDRKTQVHELEYLVSKHSQEVAKHTMELQREATKYALDVRKVNLALEASQAENEMKLKIARTKGFDSLLGTITDIGYGLAGLLD